MKGPYPIDLKDDGRVREWLAKVGCDDGGIRILAQKSRVYPLYIRDAKSPEANVLKQQMLSFGGDAAVSRHVVDHGDPLSDVILLGTLRQYEYLPQRLANQPWGMKMLGKALETLLASLGGAKTVVWKWKDRKLTLRDGHMKILGILNVTPDSFSDGGRYNTLDKALVRAWEMVWEGADAIDVGGMSTKPGHDDLSVEEELDRVMPVLEMLLREVPAPISVDTWRPAVAEAALEAGAHILNDEGGGLKSSRMPAVAARYRAPVIAMHWPSPGALYGHVAMDVADALADSVRAYEGAGLEPWQLMLDPGIGFEKTPEESLAILRDIDMLKMHGKPVLVGASRKSLIGKVLNTPVDQRLEGSLAVAAWSFMKDVDMIRVHDVQQTKSLIQMFEALAGKGTDLHEGGCV
jgi:dihydropteroate synthase